MTPRAGHLSTPEPLGRLNSSSNEAVFTTDGNPLSIINLQTLIVRIYFLGLRTNILAVRRIKIETIPTRINQKCANAPLAGGRLSNDDRAEFHFKKVKRDANLPALLGPAASRPPYGVYCLSKMAVQVLGSPLAFFP